MTVSIDIVDPKNWEGIHNTSGSDLRVKQSGLYEDCSTVCVIPTRGKIHHKVLQCWLAQINPMNQKYARIFISGMEVGAAYTQALEIIHNNPELNSWKYILTLEEDNMPPPDGLMKLLTAMHQHPEYAAIGGLYWTKGDLGQPMCYGNPWVLPRSFAPFNPPADQIVECHGLGMGFTLFRASLFKDPKIERPFFQTQQKYDPNIGVSLFTQDLWFFNNAAKHGYKFACHAGVKVGHYDEINDRIW